MSEAHLVSALILLPLLAAAGVALCGRLPALRDALSLVLGVATAACAVWLYALPDAPTPPLPPIQLAETLTFALHPERLGKLFALIAGVLWPLSTLYAIGYLRGTQDEKQTRFFVFFAIAIAAAMGVALSANLLTFFVFYEILTLSTYPLVAHYGTPEAIRAARVYLAVLIGSSVVLLLGGIIAVWVVAGTLDFTAGGVLKGRLDPSYAPALLALFAFGLGKAALMPLHRWLPAAMVAPTPVSALLHAVAVVKAGVFGMLKIIVFIFGLDFLSTTQASEWLVWVASFSLLAASVIALAKTDLKARLAYSTVSQLAYITLGAAMAAPMAASGAALHIATHAAGKITLFFCAGAIYVAHKVRDVGALDGLGRRMPLTFLCFALGAASIIGLPPTGGTWSKFLLMSGALDAGYTLVPLVLVVSVLLNLVYLGGIVVRGFFAPAAGETTFKEAPLACLVPILCTALLALLLFFYADLLTPDFG